MNNIKKLKLRMYDPRLDIIRQINTIDFSRERISVTYKGFSKTYDFDEVTILMPTGVKDSEDNMIYEGDLIYDGKVIYEVYQNECSLSYSVKEYDVEAVTSYDLKTLAEDNNLIIAGNIYKGLKWSKMKENSLIFSKNVI